MQQLEQVIRESINEQLHQVIISNPSRREDISKVKIRPVLMKGKLVFQESAYTGTKVLHRNHNQEAVCTSLLQYMKEDFKQMEIETDVHRITVLVSKKGKVTVKKKRIEGVERKETDLSHNRKKKYILIEGHPVPFLVDLGVQSKEGYIVKANYDKFKQINRYLEFVEDILPTLKKDGEITIIDFGCGKSYLTFALYYYLRVMQEINVRIIGLDLKEDVIAACNALAEKYAYEGLTFLQGDIGSYEGLSKVDMVVTLHACDTATDYALHKAVQWNAKVIFSVPCCQHELNKQIASREWEPVLKYGLIKERMSALLTDAIRANILEQNGYYTQILEFIDMEHTPKNVLIRAVKTEGSLPKQQDLQPLLDDLHLEPMLQKLLQ